jgi:tetratricopeptide (TPR) repeat protein
MLSLQALAHRTDFFVASTKLTLWYETEALLRAGEIERATEDVRRYGERIGTSRRYRIPYLRALAVLARYRGETDQAIAYLQEAAQLAEEIGLPGELWSILAAIGDHSLARGNQEQARRTFQQAAEIIRTLVDNIEDDAQRADFLAAVQARHVLEAASGSQVEQ